MVYVSDINHSNTAAIDLVTILPIYRVKTILTLNTMKMSKKKLFLTSLWGITFQEIVRVSASHQMMPLMR